MALRKKQHTDATIMIWLAFMACAPAAPAEPPPKVERPYHAPALLGVPFERVSNHTKVEGATACLGLVTSQPPFLPAERISCDPASIRVVVDATSAGPQPTSDHQGIVVWVANGHVIVTSPLSAFHWSELYSRVGVGPALPPPPRTRCPVHLLVDDAGTPVIAQPASTCPVILHALAVERAMSLRFEPPESCEGACPDGGDPTTLGEAVLVDHPIQFGRAAPHARVEHNPHAAVETNRGDTRSCATRQRAYSTQASTSSRSIQGYPSTMVATSSPAAGMPKTCSTASRCPRMIGFPPKIAGSMVMRSIRSGI